MIWLLGRNWKEIEQRFLVGEKHYTLLLKVSIALDSIAENYIPLQILSRVFVVSETGG